jgi:hypothetical protein
MGIHHIVGNNEILFVFQIVFLSNDFDPPSTCLVGWFDDLHLFGVFLFQLVDFKPIVVLGEDVRHWTLRECVVSWEPSFEL